MSTQCGSKQDSSQMYQEDHSPTKRHHSLNKLILMQLKIKHCQVVTLVEAAMDLPLSLPQQTEFKVISKEKLVLTLMQQTPINSTRPLKIHKEYHHQEKVTSLLNKEELHLTVNPTLVTQDRVDLVELNNWIRTNLLRLNIKRIEIRNRTNLRNYKTWKGIQISRKRNKIPCRPKWKIVLNLKDPEGCQHNKALHLSRIKLTLISKALIDHKEQESSLLKTQEQIKRSNRQ